MVYFWIFNENLKFLQSSALGRGVSIFVCSKNEQSL